MELDLPLRPHNPCHGADALRDLGILNLLDHDPRPTFVLDIVDAGKPELRSQLLYSNTALATAESGALQDVISGNTTAHTKGGEDAFPLQQFRHWLYHGDPISTEHVQFLDYSWRKCLIANRWLVISGASKKVSDQCQESKASGVLLSKKSIRSSFATFDWTDDLPPAKLSAHVSWARSIDWENTPLGPMRDWPPQIRSNASLIMQDPRPTVGFYGPELIMIYNESYVELLGDLHPCMGRSAREVLKPIWNDYFEPIIEQNLAGETVDHPNVQLPLTRNGFVEETYFSSRFIPIFSSEGATIGHYEPVVETTKEVILERRSQTLLELSLDLPAAGDSDAYWDHIAEVFSRNTKDIPFALLYSTESDNDEEITITTDAAADIAFRYALRRSVGLNESSQDRLQQINLRDEDSVTKLFRQAATAGEPLTVDLFQNDEVSYLAAALGFQGPFDACKAVVICPLHPPTSKDTLNGFMLLGLSARRPYDHGYLQFVHLATRLVSTSLTSIVLHQKIIGRRERAIATAEVVESKLKQRLAQSQEEADRGHSKFQRFAERSNIGIFILDMEGVYSYRNEAWYDILQPEDRDIALDEAWIALIDEDYIALGQAKFEALAVTKESQSFEIRLKNTWCVTDSGEDGPAIEPQQKWVICSIFPELSADGSIVEIIGCITDISQQKWGEQVQAAQAMHAKESKRQLEAFIDTTSHEMRNPLSAIVQCADSIVASHKAREQAMCCDKKTLAATVDSAETIVQCSKHMKNIVDDVLTMSKLDSGLFTMTPIDVQLDSIARDAVKMFEGEAKLLEIDLQFSIDDSCKRLGVVNVSLDPTRVLQILINLLTNAIKFTRLEVTRRILVSLSISLERPTHNADGTVSYISRSGVPEAKTLQTDWERGRSVFICFSVQDTGTGMSDAEHRLLFTRFSQTSPRTHINYGGSGLGLYISRSLTEMHGGAIGFISKKGVGSVFSFYVRGRESELSLRRESIKSIQAASGQSLEADTTVTRSKSFTEETVSQSQESISEDTIPNDSLYTLIVEDNLVNQRVLATQLRNAGMQVAVANHGGEALEYLQTTNYCKEDGSGNKLSLILMDWEMPVMNGLECVAEIRKLQGQGVVKRHVPVIAVTANARSEQVEIALQAGMDGVISKPCRIPELLACVQKTLRDLGLHTDF